MNISFLKEKGNKYVVYILLGALVLVLLIPTGAKDSLAVDEAESSVDITLEQQLENVLSAMEGVGEVEVMITTEDSENTLFGSTESGQRVTGVVVVAEGASSAAVNARISEAVKALFSIDAHKISIVKMKSEEEER